MRRTVPLLVVGLLLGAPGAGSRPVEAAAQAVGDHLALGLAAAEARDPATALSHFEAALALDSTDYEANWRAAVASIDLGKQTPDSVESPARDSLYAAAERLARRAVAADSTRPDGHFALAMALGRASLTKSKKERVRRAAEVKRHAELALAIAPDHDGAHHVLGRWHAEIMRLSGLTRFFARSFLGAGIFNQASWQGAIDHLERAVALAPDNIYHRLDLATVYIDRGRYADARAQLELARSLPDTDVMDPVYRDEAERLLQRIADRRDEN